MVTKVTEKQTKQIMLMKGSGVMHNKIKRGDIFYADLNPYIGSEQGGVRPILIVQNDIGNKYSSTIIAAVITSQTKTKLPTHVKIKGYGLNKDSTICLEQIRTIDKCRLREYVGVWMMN